MTLTIDLSPEREAALKAQAAARGLTVEQWLLQLAEQSGSIPALKQEAQDTWEKEFADWVNSDPDTPPLSDEAISRASLYPDRW